MKQRTYIIEGDKTIQGMLAEIAADPDYRSARSRLLLAFEPSCDPANMQALADQLKDALPDAQTVGMTTLGSTSPDLRVPTVPVFTLLLFEKSMVAAAYFDCHDKGPEEAGAAFVDGLGSVDELRGVLFLSSGATLTPEPFLDAVTERYPAVPIFGTIAGTENISIDESLLFVNRDVSERAIAAVAFSGADLHMKADFNIGFRPIGRELTVTQSDDDGFVTTIDNQPALSIYRKYLNVKPDDSFYNNVCSFPLLKQDKRRLVARVPLGCTPDGQLQFTMRIPKGTKLTLSYSKPEYLLGETLSLANGMARFAPQGLLLFACINRRVFMGNDDAEREFAYYANACPDMCWCYGYGEIMQTGEGGGILNSSLIAAGFREGPVPDAVPAPYRDAALEDDQGTYIPLSDRLVTFLEATTAELRDTIDELAVLAQRDMLTGLYNRRRMDELLNFELSRMRHTDSLVLLMYDIDHFKRINDTYGHEVGDQVLKELTHRVGEVIRSKDVLSRWGGEEFLCLVTDTSLDQARNLAERIRRHVESADFDPVGRVTVSIGVTLATFEDTVDTLFGRVDQALYDAKNSGRNRVCVR